jgi:hypothetical protein
VRAPRSVDETGIYDPVAPMVAQRSLDHEGARAVRRVPQRGVSRPGQAPRRISKNASP